MNGMSLAKLRKGALSAAAVASLVVGGGFIAAPTPAYAIYCSNCSTFYQQMFEYAEAVNTALNTAEQLQTQIQQYQNMVTQGVSLPNSMWGSIAADMKGVVNIYQRSQALGRNLQNLDQQFNTQVPGWQQYLNEVANSGQYPASQTMPDKYEKWSQQGRDNVKSALEAANMNTSSFESEDAQLQRMVARSQSAAGRMQAIQAGNEINSQNVQQLQKLRDLVATQINMQANYMAQEQNRRDLDDALRTQRRSGTIQQTGTNKGY
ncbi:P-type conjugative transfer protein TrbJ [Xanthomonas citri pv. fuscans]|nr:MULTISPECIES: P-type conjugative transfer protein TrbJ [Xanthomonas]ATS74319.1 P-type conjugative transfer protein TrbJ [Xanthomonas citri pv. phaseoli var. fuscans]ECG5279080.1 P-type conjugative transfer protein TrbJ [Salmonella enterica subsp. enterica serovar Agona]EEH6870609.1 P-type conjugative transfer protein TrbJ [Salmonella enterica]SON76099.1 P-type conjugative transfer protein TrbJ [Xanthomonas citri pv. fuscans]